MIEHSHQTIATNGINLHVVQAGPEDGPLVILLHGFPEFWYGMKAQMDFLAAQGFRVWVPDQRGYNLSDKPEGSAAYNLDNLAADVVGLMDAATAELVYLVGHDWGAAVAWWTAIKYPDRIKKLVIMNVPHPVVMNKHLRSSFDQMRKSWYIFFFQIPALPEFSLRRNNYAQGASALLESSNPGSFTEEDIRHYREAWSQPGALTGMLNWYRAVMQHAPPTPKDYRIKMPTLMIWGANDVALDKEMTQPSIDLCDEGRLVLFDDATHWVQHDKPDEVNALLKEFFS